MLNINDRMDKDYFELFEFINKSKEALNKWLEESSLEVLDEKEFITDIQRQLVALSSHLLRFKHARILIAEHKEKNYDKELSQVVELCSELNKYIGDHYNPIFENRDEQYIEASQKLRDVEIYLRSKLVDICEEKRVNAEGRLKEHKKILEEYEKIVGVEKAIQKIILAKGTSEKDKIDFLIALKICKQKEEKLSVNLDELKRQDKLDYKYDFTKTKNMREIRIEFLESLANVFKYHTGRTSLKRTKEEKGKRRKTPFKELAEVCFREMGEELKSETLKKLLAVVNK